MGVGNDARGLREHGLDPIAFGHGSVSRLEEVLDVGHRFGSEFERLAEGLGHRFAG